MSIRGFRLSGQFSGRITGLFVVLLFQVSAGPVVAQEAESSGAVHVQDGIAAFEAGRYDAAVRHFETVIQQRPSTVHDEHGTAAWWLGRVHRAQGDSAEAHVAWRAGVNALSAADTLDVRLADAYVRSVFEQGKTREQTAAADLYLRLIERAGSDLQSAERAVAYRHVAQALPVLPDEKRSRVTPDPKAFRRGKAGMTDDAGSWLVAWWRRQDARPATVRNERLIEHLRRVVVAEQRYATDRRRAGFDDRGRVYVRLGPPSVVEHLDNDAIRDDGLCGFCEIILDGGSWVPENEYWVYEDLGSYAQFLFVKQKGRYVMGTFWDLLPAKIRGPVYTLKASATSFVGGAGGGQKSKEAGLAMKALRDYYEQVVQYQPNYLALLHKIERHLFRNLPPGKTLEGGYAPPIPGTDGRVRINEAQRTDHRLAQKRSETVPTARTKTVDSEDQLQIAARTARFLTDDGSTRTEVYWAVNPADLAPAPADQFRLVQQGVTEPERYRLRLTSVRYGPDYTSRHVARADQRIDTDRSAPAVYSLAVPETTHDRYHLALQWDQYVVSEADSSAAFVRRGTYRADSIRALSTDLSRLVMSDLVPLRAGRLAEVEQVRDEQSFTVTPYPYDHVTPTTNLALYVEAYHLTYGADDRTRYTVEYEVEQRREKGGVLGWFGATEEEVTTQSSTYEGTSRTAREAVALDLSPYAGASRLRITVRLIDEMSGQRAERTIAFDVRESGE